MFVVRHNFQVDVKEIPKVKSFVESTLSNWGVSREDLDDIVLACDEAATNIILHAYGPVDEARRKSDTIELTLRKKRNVVEVILRDRGISFDMAKVPLPDIRLNLAGKRRGGFGVHLMRSLMSRIRYQCRDGENRTILLKRLSS
ncbi:MAG: ATP-binding protein [Leptospiraceae bacterium]|nr:ATP-binding protein [Leptospiraceae bacterium]MDW8306109.1 ATP-binding protein [Leptospiraceae bacterium]